MKKLLLTLSLFIGAASARANIADWVSSQRNFGAQATSQHQNVQVACNWARQQASNYAVSVCMNSGYNNCSPISSQIIGYTNNPYYLSSCTVQVIVRGYAGYPNPPYPYPPQPPSCRPSGALCGQSHSLCCSGRCLTVRGDNNNVCQ